MIKLNCETFRKNSELEDLLQGIRDVGSEINNLYAGQDEYCFKLKVKEVFEEFARPHKENHLHIDEFEPQCLKFILTKSSFQKYLYDVPLFLSERLFSMFTNKLPKYVAQKEFYNTLKCLKYGNGEKDLLQLIFVFFDTNGNEKIQYEGIKQLLSLILLHNRDKREETGIKQLLEQVCSPFFGRKNISFKKFSEILADTYKMKDNLFNVVLNFVFESIPLLRCDLSIQALKYNEFLKINDNSKVSIEIKKAECKFSSDLAQNNDTCENSTKSLFAIASPLPKRKDGNTRLSGTGQISKLERYSNIEFEHLQLNKPSLTSCLKHGSQIEHGSPLKISSRKSKFAESQIDCRSGNSLEEKKLKKTSIIIPEFFHSANKKKAFHSSEAESSEQKQSESVTKSVFKRSSTFNVDCDDEDVLIKQNLEKSKVLEDEFLIEDSDKLDDRLFLQYLVLFNDYIYSFKEEDELSRYIDSFYLKGAFVRENKAKIPSKDFSEPYYSLTIFFVSSKEMTLYHKDEKVVSKWIKTVRTVLGYKNFFDSFKLLEEVSSGSDCAKSSSYKVYHAEQKLTNPSSSYNVKIYEKGKHLSWKFIKTQLDINKLTDKSCELYENSNYCFIVSQVAQNLVTLSSYYLTYKPCLSESKIARILFKLASHLKQIHCLGIAHTNLNLETIKVSCDSTPTEESLEVKIEGFGDCFITELGNSISCEKNFDLNCRNIYYCPPELLKCESISTSVDIWSLGVIIYYLVYGHLCFKNTPFKKEAIESICTKNLTFPEGTNTSKEVRDLIHLCLNKTPNKRITIDEFLSHSWFQKRMKA